MVLKFHSNEWKIFSFTWFVVWYHPNSVHVCQSQGLQVKRVGSPHSVLPVSARKASYVWSRHSSAFISSIMSLNTLNLTSSLINQDDAHHLTYQQDPPDLHQSSLCTLRIYLLDTCNNRGQELHHQQSLSHLPLYWTMPAKLSISSSRKDLTSITLLPSRPEHSLNFSLSAGQFSSLVTMVSTVVRAVLNASLHPEIPVHSRASITTCTFLSVHFSDRWKGFYTWEKKLLISRYTM